MFARLVGGRALMAVAGGVALGGHAAAQVGSYTEECLARGVSYLITEDQVQFGTGVALVDLDGDGDADLVATGAPGGVIGLFENDGTGHFTSRSAGSGLPTLSMPSSVTAADYDSDGDLDLHFSLHGPADVLMRNDGNFTFTNVTAAAGIGDTGMGMGCVWGDYDNDGWIDLYVANRSGALNNFTPNRLFHNNGDGTFTDVAQTLGVADGTAPTLLCTFVDYDRDGDADLYLGTDKGSGLFWRNRLYQNQGDGTFIDVTAATGTEAFVDCMGIAIGDCDENGWPDFYVTNIHPGNRLLLNPGNAGGAWTDATLAADVGSYVVGWGAAFFDYDHDTLLDLYVCCMAANNRMYRHDGAWPCTDVAPALGIDDPETSYCMAIADIDLDGDLDLVVQSHGVNLRMYVNQSGANGNWARFKVAPNSGNTFAVGAIVEILANGKKQFREVYNGANYKSQNEHTLHFGLGAATTMQTIRAVWPGGESRTLHNYPANETWTVYPAARLGDANGNGAIDAADLRAALARLPGPFQPGDEVFDMDGDGDVDASDVGAMLPVRVSPGRAALP
ncbi:MAG: CRTAC1 family protein [Phycisphaerales bacterium]|jgi:hypothetical protein|nr:CRTAC1 family protein [Phycisphaerales bacterium]